MYIHKYIHIGETFTTVTKKLTKHGNSYALIIERPILDLLGVDGETVLQISTPDEVSIIITPMKGKEQKRRFATSLKKINKKYGRTLKQLAE